MNEFISGLFTGILIGFAMRRLRWLFVNDEQEDDLKSRIAELEATVEIDSTIINAYEKRVSEIVRLSNETVDKLNKRIIELETKYK